MDEAQGTQCQELTQGENEGRMYVYKIQDVRKYKWHSVGKTHTYVRFRRETRHACGCYNTAGNNRFLMVLLDA